MEIPPWEQACHFKVRTSTPSESELGRGLIIVATLNPLYDYGTALTRFSNGFMADPVQDFINFNWKLRQDVARVDNYKQATAQVCTGQWAEAVAQWRGAGGRRGVLGFA